MKRTKCIAYWSLLSLLVLSASAASAAEEKAPSEAADDIVAKRAERSRSNFAKQDERMVKARELAAQQKYVEALKIMEDVLAELDLEKSGIDSEVASERLISVRREARRVRHAYGETILLDARKLAADGKYSEAANRAAEAVKLAVDVAEVPGMGHKIDSALKSEADALMTYCRNMEQNASRREEVSLKRAQAPDYEEKQKKIRQYLGEALTYTKNKRYEEALASLEQVFILDPLNTEAMRLSTQLYQLIYRYGLARTKTDASVINDYSQWQWAEPVFVRLPNASNVREGKIKADSGSAVDDKLKRIIFPRVNFADTGIQAVLNQLEKRSKDFDPDKEGLVINRILPQDSDLTVRLNCNNISLGDILRYICLMTGLEYRVDGNSILVSRDAASETRTRTWMVGSQLFSDVLATDGTAAAKNDDGGGDAGGGDGGGDAGDNAGDNAGDTGDNSANTKSTSANNPTPQQWYNFFTKNMISIPKGWRITSDDKAQTVTVSSSSSCLREIDEFIHLFDANQEEKLVMIEIRALEISETDAQELGFNWTMGLFGYNMDNSGNLGDPDKHSGWLLGQGANTEQGGEGAMNVIRDTATLTGLGNTKVINNLNIFPALFGSQNWFGSDTPVDIRLTVNALAQNRRVETLSAPKLMTMNGVEANVSVGKRYYFPTDWDDLEIELETTETGIGSYYKITLPTPTISEDGTELGIKLRAKPTILDNRVIRLELHPDITAYLGQDNGDGRYDIKVYGYEITNGKAGANKLLFKYPIWRAKTSIRRLDLTVDVYDGETVVIGGIIDNAATNRTDKMPILADLPLIGRFFQSQAENSTKQNLIMFVTARIVDLYGNPVRHLKNVGTPDFNR